MTALLCAVFALSGAAALIFENLWFRQAGLTFGNGVWASSLVVASFMGGLALGNALAARYSRRLRDPLRVYVGVEIVVAACGWTLVLALPQAGETLAPLFRPLLDTPLVLNGLRTSLAFVMLAVPATAMGATLPLLVAAGVQRDPDFGRVLARLYGWNTAGAVVGSLACDLVLLAPFGILGTGGVAATLNLLSAAGAACLCRRWTATAAPPVPELPPPGAAHVGPVAGLLVAAFLCGGILLALEVVWFRLLLLFIVEVGGTFGVLLAVVLAGIALGGLAAGAWLRTDPRAGRWVPLLASAAGAATILTYAVYGPAGNRPEELTIVGAGGIFALAVPLMLPTSLCSGALFTLLGTEIDRRLSAAGRSAGLLTLCNTLGAMLGALLAGFVLLPYAGSEVSLFLLALGYGMVALLGIPLAGDSRGRRWSPALAVAGGVFVLCAVAFPFGRMENRILAPILDTYLLFQGATADVVREGRTATLILMRRDLLDEPLDHRLLTNNYSMTANDLASRRYMKLFAYLPAALRPQSKSSLLICYGLGTTARALLDARPTGSVDIVDLSPEILALSPRVFRAPGTDPLQDPRVKVHVEDGRFFLQVTDRRFDLITAEPPPPKHAGVGTLYSREFFDLVRRRLAPGGLCTYWLPVNQMFDQDFRAIVRAFCDVFPDATLWTGSGWHWILLGSDGTAVAGPTEEELSASWRSPATAGDLADLGLERPERLGATFLADARDLADWTRDSDPLVDDRPHRLVQHYPDDLSPWFHEILDPARARERFLRSAEIRKLWPAGLREGTAAAFAVQAGVNQALGSAPPGAPPAVEWAERLLRDTDLTAVPLWLLGADDGTVRAIARLRARGVDDPRVDRSEAVCALARRRWEDAVRLLERAWTRGANDWDVLQLRTLALCLAGRVTDARALAASAPSPAGGFPDAAFWAFLARRFEVPVPAAAR